MMLIISISITGISSLLRGLNAHKSAGPDGICARLLQLSPDKVSLHLEVIFQKCLNEGSFPDDWKRANVTPVLKKGSKSE